MSQNMLSPEKTALDAICRRLREGRKMCVEVAHYFKQRSKAEHEYTKTLLTCLKNMVLKDDGSPFDDWWREVKAQTKETADIHCEAAEHFNCLADELILFTDDQARLAQETEENIKTGNAIENEEFRKALAYRNYYQEKRKMYKAATETHNILKKFVTTPKKDLIKAKIKEERLEKDKEVAAIAYEKSVERFVQFCKMWEPRMEKSFKDMEDLEIKRLETLRDKLWKGTNIDSLTAVKHDECCENIRKNLEKFEIFIDFKIFARNPRSLKYRRSSSPTSGSDISRGSPVAHSTPKSRRPWSTLQPRPKNFIVDEFGYATANPPPESDNFHGSPWEETKDRSSAFPSHYIPNETRPRSQSDFGYANIQDVERERNSDSNNDPEDLKVSAATNGNSNCLHCGVDSSAALETRQDTEGIPGLSSPEDFASCTDEDVEIWKDNFGYASVKDIRRRKHTVQTEAENNLQRAFPVKDTSDLMIPDKEHSNTVKDYETKHFQPPDISPRPSIDERTTWL